MTISRPSEETGAPVDDMQWSLVAETMRSPVAMRLETVVGGTILSEFGVSPPPGEYIERVPEGKVGEYRVDLAILGQAGTPATQDSSNCLLVALRERPEIEDAVLVPPRIYIRVALPFLMEAVQAAPVRRPDPDSQGHVPQPALVSLKFCDPNMNKPLHVGHLRNLVLSESIARLFESTGSSVLRSQLRSDWGLHICRALVGYLQWGQSATPSTAHVRGDKLVGSYYVQYHQAVEPPPSTEDESRVDTQLLEDEARAVLHDMEVAGNPRNSTLTDLKAGLTAWVAEGMSETFTRLGCRFDDNFAERENLARSRAIVEGGLDSGVCHRRDDGSVHINLAGTGVAPEHADLTLVRSDGTLLVYARTFGGLLARHESHQADVNIDVLGADWRFSNPALLEALAALGYPWARDNVTVFHGMVRTPQGRIRSRAGDVLTADDFLDRVVDGMSKRWPPAPLSDSISLSPAQYERVGVAFAKYHVLRRRREHDMTINLVTMWDESYERFQSLCGTLVRLGRFGQHPAPEDRDSRAFSPISLGARAQRDLRDVLRRVDDFPEVVARATRRFEPALVVRYIDGLVAGTTPLTRHPGLLPTALWSRIAGILDAALWILGIDLSVLQATGVHRDARLSHVGVVRSRDGESTLRLTPPAEEVSG